MLEELINIYQEIAYQKDIDEKMTGYYTMNESTLKSIRFLPEKDAIECMKELLQEQSRW